MSFLLLQTGDKLLLQNGGRLLLATPSTPPAVTLTAPVITLTLATTVCGLSVADSLVPPVVAADAALVSTCSINTGGYLHIPPVLTLSSLTTVTGVQIGGLSFTIGTLATNLDALAANLLLRHNLAVPTGVAVAGEIDVQVLISGSTLTASAATSAAEATELNVVAGGTLLSASVRTGSLFIADYVYLSTALTLISPILYTQLAKVATTLAVSPYVVTPAILTSDATASSIPPPSSLLAIMPPLIGGQAYTETLVIAGYIALASPLLPAAYSCSDAVITTVSAVYPIVVAAVASAQTATLLPGTVTIAASDCTSVLANTAVALSPGSIFLAPSQLELALASMASSIHSELEAVAPTVTVATATSSFTPRVTLRLVPIMLTGVWVTESCLLDVWLRVTIQSLGSEFSGVAATAVPEILRLVPPELTATVVSTTVVVIVAHFGLYADTPFIATTGSMFE